MRDLNFDGFLVEGGLEGELLLLDLAQDLPPELVPAHLVLLVLEEVLRLHLLLAAHAAEVQIRGLLAVAGRLEGTSGHFSLVALFLLLQQKPLSFALDLVDSRAEFLHADGELLAVLVDMRLEFKATELQGEACILILNHGTKRSEFVKA